MNHIFSITYMLKTKHYLYNSWSSMHQRCSKTYDKDYPRYGGRGIKVCSEWNDFWVFVEDMGDRPEGYTIERTDNDKGYSKDNCRWASRAEQASNRNPRKPYVQPSAKGYRKSKGGKYYASIWVETKNIHLGSFDCPLMARLAFTDATAKRLAGLPVK